MNMLDTLKDSYFSEILPKGRDIQKIHECTTNDPTTAITSGFIPSMPGRLFFMEELAGPLCPDTN